MAPIQNLKISPFHVICCAAFKGPRSVVFLTKPDNNAGIKLYIFGKAGRAAETFSETASVI